MMQAIYKESKPVYRMSSACSFCKEQCQHYATVQGWFVEGKIGENEIDKAIGKISELFQQKTMNDSWLHGIELLIASDVSSFETALCFLGLILNYSS